MTTNSVTVLDLPLDVYEMIFAYVSVRETVAFGATCVGANRIVNDAWNHRNDLQRYVRQWALQYHRGVVMPFTSRQDIWKTHMEVMATFRRQRPCESLLHWRGLLRYAGHQLHRQMRWYEDGPMTPEEFLTSMIAMGHDVYFDRRGEAFIDATPIGEDGRCYVPTDTVLKKSDPLRAKVRGLKVYSVARDV
jgi:hypothetical protein